MKGMSKMDTNENFIVGLITGFVGSLVVIGIMFLIVNSIEIVHQPRYDTFVELCEHRQTVEQTKEYISLPRDMKIKFGVLCAVWE